MFRGDHTMEKKLVFIYSNISLQFCWIFSGFILNLHFPTFARDRIFFSFTVWMCIHASRIMLHFFLTFCE